MPKDELNDELIISLYEALRPCVDAAGCNGPAFYMIAQELAKSGKPVLNLTLGELAEIVSLANARYNRMCDRLKNLKEVARG